LECAGRGPRIDELVVFATSIKGRGPVATEYIRRIKGERITSRRLNLD